MGDYTGLIDVYVKCSEALAGAAEMDA